MPIYEYRCASCGHELEALQKLSDAPLTVCPACNNAELKKLVSAAGFQLKGSGWYVTDFRNSGAKQPAKSATAKDAAKGNAGEAKSDAKPESKAGESSGSETTTATTRSRSSDGASDSKSTTTTSSDKTGT